MRLSIATQSTHEWYTALQLRNVPSWPHLVLRPLGDQNTMQNEGYSFLFAIVSRLVCFAFCNHPPLFIHCWWIEMSSPDNQNWEIMFCLHFSWQKRSHQVHDFQGEIWKKTGQAKSFCRLSFFQLFYGHCCCTIVSYYSSHLYFRAFFWCEVNGAVSVRLVLVLSNFLLLPSITEVYFCVTVFWSQSRGHRLLLEVFLPSISSIMRIG